MNLRVYVSEMKSSQILSNKHKCDHNSEEDIFVRGEINTRFTEY